MSKKKKRKAEKTAPSAPETEISAVKDAEDDVESIIKEAQSNYATVPHSDSFTEEDFASSVDRLTEEDFASEEKKTRKKKKKKFSKAENIIQISFLGICAVVAVICAVMLVKNIYGKVKGNEIYSGTSFDKFTLNDSDGATFNHPSKLLQITGDNPMLTLYERITAGKSADNTNAGEYAEKLSAMKASLTALKAKNEEIYGWIYVENTGIDYPILRGSDNTYYLDHAYTGESLPIGSIFLDYTTKDLITDNRNTVIYGHNVVTGAMFHDVTKFLDESFFNANKIYIYTMDGVFIYKPISIYPTTEKYFYYRTGFTGDDDFVKFAAEVISKSSVKSEEKVGAEDTIITLSTCTNSSDGGRYALHAKLAEVIK